VRRFALLLLPALLWAGAAGAVLPDEQLADPALEARARAISQGLRCVVCQNQSIDDSDAPLARDLRVVVRERLKAGASDAEVVDYVVDRYGSFVLLKPPFEPATWALWLAPFAVVALGAAGVAAYIAARRPPAAPAALSAEEQAQLDEILRRSES